MIELPSIADGDSGPIYRFTCKDAGAVLDQNACAVEMYLYDEDGTFLARRVGLPVSPKANGQIDLMLLGRTTDWDGAGRRVILKPKIYVAVAPGGGLATNLLLTPSFDADGDANGIADNWSLQGAKTATWALTSDDPYPPVVFGSAQRVKHAGLADPDFIQQNPAVTLAVGDFLSGGVWYRGTGTAGAGANDNHALLVRRNGGTNAVTRFPVVESDWRFVRAATVVDVGQSSAFLVLDGRGTTMDNRYDDAFLFKGEWWIVPTEALRIPVSPRNRAGKNSNQIAGLGGFEIDTDGDGLADGFSKVNASGVTFALDKNPANVYMGFASQNVTLANFTSKRIELVHRAKFKAGDVWRASVRVKTNGALTGSPSAGQWAIQLSTDPFCDDAAPVTGTAVDFGTSLGSFTLYQASITIGSETSSLRISLWINGVAGSAWLDDLQLFRVTP